MAEENQPRFRPSFGTDYVTLQEERRREIQATQEERLGAGELWDAVTESEWVGPRLEERQRFETGASLFEDAQAPVIPAERLERDLGADYTQDEQDFIAKATSEEDYQARLDKVARDRQLSQTIAKEGLRGTLYSIAAGMSDPALLPLYIGTGGTASVGRLGLLAKTLRSGALGAAEGAAVESVLATGDTQRDLSDVILAGMSGGIVTGGITLGTAGLRRTARGRSPNPNLDNLERDPALTETAQGLDADLARMQKDYREDQAIAAMESNLSIDYLTSIDARQSIMDELLPVAQQRLSRGDRQPMEAEVRSLERDVQRLRQEQEAVPRPDAGGTARLRREAAQARQARIAEIEARLEPIKARMTELQRTLDEDLPAREAWADISRLAQGQIPERFRERIEKMQQEDLSPLNRNESRIVRDAARKAQEARQARADAEAEAVVRRPEGAAQEADTASVGAARVEGVRDPQDAYAESGNLDTEDQLFEMNRVGASLPNRDRLRRLAGAGMKRLSSTYSKLMGSESNIIKGIAHTVLADPQAQARGHISAAHRVVNYHDRLVNAEGGREAVARDEWAREIGINPLRLHMAEEGPTKDFDNAVVLQIRGIDQGSEAIRKAAEARRDVLREALKIRKEAGEAGFENVEDHQSYWSFLPDFNKMQEMVSTHGVDRVLDLLTGAYMNGRFKLRENSARMVANATYRRVMRQGLSDSESSKYALSKADIGALRSDMEEAGVPTNQIDEFLEEIERTELEHNVSDRAKLSLGASMTYQVDDTLRMVDVLDTSINVTQRYAQEAAAGAALARSGFKSRGELTRVLDDAEVTSKNALFNEATEKGISIRAKRVTDTVDGKRQKVMKYEVVKDGKQKTVTESELQDMPIMKEDFKERFDNITDEIQTIRDSVKLLYGESLDTNVNLVIKGSRVARKMTNLVALQWNGFASVGEASNQLVNMGVVTTLRNTRAKDFLSFGKIRESKDLQSVGNLVGAYGQLGSSIKDNNYTLQTMDEYNQGKVERIFNNASGWVSNKSQLLSGFRSVQHGLENVLLRSMQDRMIRIADGDLKPKQRDFDEMERAGLRRDQIDEVFRSIKDNPEYVEMDGKQVRVFSGKHLPTDLREDLGVAMTTMLSRNMQRSFVGETPIWMSKELGKLVTQFRSFSIVSIEKQLAAGLRGDTIGMFLKTMFGVMLATGAYTSRAWIRSQLDEDPEEKWEQYTSPMALSTGVVNMTPHLGLAGMGMEFGYASNLIPAPEDTYLGRAGSRPFTLSNLVPAIGVAEDAANVGRSALGLIMSPDSEEAMETLKEARGMAPLLNSAAIGTAMAIANKSVE